MTLKENDELHSLAFAKYFTYWGLAIAVVLHVVKYTHLWGY